MCLRASRLARKGYQPGSASDPWLLSVGHVESALWHQCPSQHGKYVLIFTGVLVRMCVCVSVCVCVCVCVCARMYAQSMCNAPPPHNNTHLQDIKIGRRTFQETEVTNEKTRMDLLKKVAAVFTLLSLSFSFCYYVY